MRDLKITPKTTYRDSDSIEKYFQEINKYELISQEEEARLAQNIHKGDKQSLEKLVNSNLRFVISVAKQYQGRGIPLPDLIEEGNIGLIKAAKKYDEKKGFKFISYAVWWIRQSIMQSIRQNAEQIRLPANKSDKISKLKNIENYLTFKEGREVSKDEVLEHIKNSEGISRNCQEDYEEALRYSDKKYKSLNEPLKNSGKTFGETIGDDTFPETDKKLTHDESLSKTLETHLNKLPPQISKMLKMRYGINNEKKEYTVKEIAKENNLSEQRIRDYLNMGERALRKDSEGLKEFL